MGRWLETYRAKNKPRKELQLTLLGDIVDEEKALLDARGESSSPRHRCRVKTMCNLSEGVETAAEEMSMMDLWEG